MSKEPTQEGTEEWRPIEGFDGAYSVSSIGRVRSNQRQVNRGSGNGREPGTRTVPKKLKKLTIAYGKYLTVSLYHGDVEFRPTVHSLVAAAFIGPRPSGMEVCHNDGDNRNNDHLNLRYDTRAGNARDCAMHGTLKFGDSAPSAKLNEILVSEIRAAKGISQRAQAKKYGVTQLTIWRIRAGKSWKHSFVGSG